MCVNPLVFLTKIIQSDKVFLMKNKYILVIGGATLDCTYLQSEDLSYRNEPDIIVPGGKGSNQAVAASLAGAKVKFVSRLSSKKEEISKTNDILDNLKNKGVDVSRVELDPIVNNDICNIYVSREGENEIKRSTGAINSFDAKFVDKNLDIIKNAQYVIAQTKAPKEFTKRLIEKCYENKVPIIITPSRPEQLDVGIKENIDLIEKITFITANKKEVQKMFGLENIEDCLKLYPNKLIVTLGEKGCVYFDGKEIKNIKGVKTQVVDTTGAGDTLNGNFVAGLMQGLNIEQALFRGVMAATLKLSKVTAQKGMPTKNELDTFINSTIKTDLHIHTTASDGAYHVNEVLEQIEGPALISITDHDCVDGYFDVDYSLLSQKRISLLTGCEFSFEYKGVCKDMLAYGIDVEKVKTWIESRYTHDFAIKKQQIILDNFICVAKRHGVNVEPNITIQTGKKSEAYIKVKAAIKADPQSNKSIVCQDGFYRKYFANPQSDWYVCETMGLPSLHEIIDLIHSWGGKAILAHPYSYAGSLEQKNDLINAAINCGVDGLEVQHYSNQGNDVGLLRKIVKDNNLLESGGSDFHGLTLKSGVKLFVARDNIDVKYTKIIKWTQNLIKKAP